jgi:DNA polymerase-1
MGLDIPEPKYTLEEIEFQSQIVFQAMHKIGIGINAKDLTQDLQYHQQKLEDTNNSLKHITGMSLRVNSRKDISEYAKSLVITLPSTKKGNVRTDSETLKRFLPPSIELSLILKGKTYLHYTSILKKLIPKIKKDRLHPIYQFQPELARVYAKGVNITGLPHKIRQYIIPSQGHYFIEADYQAIELRVLAALSQDPALLETINSYNTDIHRIQASRLFQKPLRKVTMELRETSKQLTFGIIYGMSPQSLAQKLKTTKEHAQSLMDSFFQTYPKVLDLIIKIQEQALTTGIVYSYFGRKRSLYPLLNQDPQKSLRVAVNHVIQSTAGDILRIGLINLDNALIPFKARILTTVFDSVLIEVPYEHSVSEVKPLIQKVLVYENDPLFSLDLTIKTGPTWATLSKTHL